ncbi:hypothetical protein JOF56_007841 [Kibdelosporangium banguiense]|uniref:Uncharacterized protein n=1 Tax=Kibdelosporangium banguiense TaxID=1365924 RepID=A0ABS4TSR8_9PSEU|nr:hypothetical protein [Kibdelosporangium banguiense]MBP2327456.1 hypothetical protein [Kibdelosporangium banguiense]
MATVLAMVLTPGPAGAAGAVLWECWPFSGNEQFACTTITSAPAAGVQVLDHNTGQIYTLRNGNSVALWSWSKDKSGQCGVYQNEYVWIIAWQNAGFHWAYIGDHYVKTGEVPDWNDFPDSLDHLGYPGLRGHLGDRYHDGGTGRGTCDIYPNG